MVLGAVQRTIQCLNITDKFMTSITLFHSDLGYYEHIVDLHVPWILFPFHGNCGYIRIFWILFVLIPLRDT